MLRTLVRRPCSKIHHQHQSRAFSWNPVPIVGQGILEVGNAISNVPLPEFIGPYAAGIVVSTVVLRACVTLPVFFWARRRVARHRDIVIPKIIEWRKSFAKTLAAEAKKHPNPKEWFDSEFKDAAIKYRANLLREYKCQPLYTALAGPVTLIPTIVLKSLAIRSLCALPESPFLSETFLSAVPLAFPDGMGIFPLAVGLLSFANVELSRKTAEQRAKAMRETEWVKRHAQSTKDEPSNKVLVQTSKGWEAVSNTSKVKQPVQQKDSVIAKVSTEDDPGFKQVSRLSKLSERIGAGGSILMIGIAMLSPGALTLCWATSSSFSLMQTMLGRYYDKRDAERAS